MSDRDDWRGSLAGYEQLRELHESLRAEIRTRWQRSLPFADELFDRWERAAHLGFGSGASIYDSSLVIGDVRVGEHTWIGPFTVLDGSGGGLAIGHHCSISSGVQVYTHDTLAWALTGGRAQPVRSPTAIGDCTYVGPNAVIARGVTIGSRCVIGAASLVNRDVPDGKISVGTPARIVGRVEVEGDEVRMIYDSDSE